MGKVKTLRYNINFVGYGGTNVNTLHWLTEMSKLVNTVNLFESVIIYENESVEVSNLLRFPKDPSSLTPYPAGAEHKFSLLSGELERLSREYCVCKGYYRPSSEIAGALQFTDYRGNAVSSKHIFYGAPNIDTRIALSKAGNFISATHGSSECSLHLNPAQDADLQVESYGVIQLGGFFMNQLRMAIGFLEILADPDFDPTVQNKELLNFSFDGTAKLKTDRSYNFQLKHNNLVMTETEAEDI